MLIRWIVGMGMIGLMLFLPAGTWAYWPGWLYCGVLFIPMLFVLAYFLVRDPALLERRMRFKEKEQAQRRALGFGNVAMIVGFLVPGFDYRFGWSTLPAALILAAAGVVLLGYLLFFFVLRANSYASRVVEIEAGQQLITTGPYAWVRHPMYSAVLVMFMFTPLALGSYWALLPFSGLIPTLVLRIRNEEQVLRDGLEGYAEYCERVRFRLVPGVW